MSWACLTHILLSSFREKWFNQNNQNPKATIGRKVEETRDKVTNTAFSVLSDQTVHQIINMHGALITCG